jgi:demethylmenaquinone methyltransferase/2-methoxy-6-polyprenyl-1,4-benzoquinol methylase
MTTPAPDASRSAPVWKPEELADPHAVSEKASKVRGMFSAIAPSYDLNNRVHSLWLDQSWRKSTVKAARVQPGDVVLDVACGTGDLTMAFARSPASMVIGLDFTPAMLAIAETKRPRINPDEASKITYEEGDAQHLRFQNATFNVVSIAFGIRNVADPSKALREFSRVLRPGGRLVILEFQRPPFPPFSWLYDFYCGWIMPRSATLLSGDRSGAYRYLPASVGSFMSRQAMVKAINQDAGLECLHVKTLTFGLCNCFVARKP